MADPILHIKDSFYFEVPKFMARSHEQGKFFPDFWVRLDDQFQEWEAKRLGDELQKLEAAPFDKNAKEAVDANPIPAFEKLEHEYLGWKHDHANHGKPFDVYLEENSAALQGEYKTWKSKSPDNKNETLETFLVQADPPAPHREFGWFAVRNADAAWRKQWAGAKETAGGDEAVRTFKNDSAIQWSPEKVEGYNKALSGKILIPQLPGTRLKNLYEVESGLGVSRFMILEAFVAVMMIVIFVWLANRVRSSDRPQGKIWNLLEAILLFIRDQIARPSIGHHEGDKFVPYLWTIFLFILGCNLVGMFPWAGAPAASFSVTLSLAVATFLVGLVSGIRKFGFLGYWKNQVPHMELPTYMAIPLLPAIFVIEVMGLFIKHGVLGIRLMANIGAGHLVLVSLLGLTFTAVNVEALGMIWTPASLAVILGSAALSCLELFVAFLQAYVFTLLSALFIGAAVHHH